MELGKMGEFGLIERISRQVEARGNRVLTGIGDDAAVFDIGSGKRLLATCDSQIEEIHFSWRFSTPKQVGERVASVNLSDIAAMGGVPLWALVSLGIPKSLSSETIAAIYDGMESVFRCYDVEIAGGNTAHLPERTLIDVTLLGEATLGRPLLRSGAKVGDVLCVTGSLGRSAAGLALLQKGERLINEVDDAGLKSSYRTPTPRMREGVLLVESGAVSACMDISDGLASDVRHMAKASHVNVLIDIDRLPISPAVYQACDQLHLGVLETALGGGEDFELLFTVHPGEVEALCAHILATTGTPVTPIGKIQAGDGTVVFEKGDQPFAWRELGFDHFR